MRQRGRRFVETPYNNSLTSDFSPFSSATDASIFARLKSFIGSPCTISHFPPRTRTRNEEINPCSTSQLRSEQTATLAQGLPDVWLVSEQTVSTIASAAASADERPQQCGKIASVLVITDTFLPGRWKECQFVVSLPLRTIPLRRSFKWLDDHRAGGMPTPKAAGECFSSA